MSRNRLDVDSLMLKCAELSNTTADPVPQRYHYKKPNLVELADSGNTPQKQKSQSFTSTAPSYKAADWKDPSLFSSDLFTLYPEPKPCDNQANGNIEVSSPSQLQPLENPNMTPFDSRHPPWPPVAILNSATIPEPYIRWASVCTQNQNVPLLDTAKTCEVLSRFGLPKQQLGIIWSLVNRSAIGQLTREEFYLALILVDKVQKGLQPCLENLDNHLDPSTKQFYIPRDQSNIKQSPIQKTAADDFGDFADFSSGQNHNQQNLNTAADHSYDTTSITSSSLSESSKERDPQQSTNITPGTGDPSNTQKEDPSTSVHSEIWWKCLSAITIILSEALLFLSDNSTSVINVLKTEKGLRYFSALSDTWIVFSRVSKSARQHATDTGKFSSQIDSCDQKFRTVLSLYIDKIFTPQNNELSIDKYLTVLSSNSPEPCPNLCRVCFTNTSSSNDITQPLPEPLNFYRPNQAVLNYAGRNYHAACANLWTNYVELTLPTLDTKPTLI